MLDAEIYRVLHIAIGVKYRYLLVFTYLHMLLNRPSFSVPTIHSLPSGYISGYHYRFPFLSSRDVRYESLRVNIAANLAQK